MALKRSTSQCSGDCLIYSAKSGLHVVGKRQVSEAPVEVHSASFNRRFIGICFAIRFVGTFRATALNGDDSPAKSIS
jgi:hypothetical protein